MCTWNNKDFYMKFSKDWDESVNPVTQPYIWTQLESSSSKRKRTHVQISGEAFKLSLVSFEKDSSLDAFAYYVDYDKDGVISQEL